MNLTEPLKRHAEILIVEDSPTQAEHLRALLEAKGYQLFAARDGEQALDHLKETMPDLVISDVVMPGVGGYELCRRIKDDPRTRSLPVILLTSLNDPADVVRGLEAGADNFLFKPFDDAYLIKRIEFALANRSNEEANMSRMGIEVGFGGRKFYITSDRLQVLNLLLSTYEAAVQRNHELIQVRDELRVLNESLESHVRERTRELEAALARESTARSEMQRLNEQLSRSEARFRGMFMSAVVGIAITDLNGRFQQANPAYCAIVGYAEEELRALDFPALTHPEDRPANVAEVHRIVSGEVDGQVMEKRYLRKSGEVVWVRVSVSAVRDESGAPQHIIGVVQDITARRQAEERIREQNEILSNSHEGVMVMNLANEVVWWNRGAEKTFGWTADEALGCSPEKSLGIDNPVVISNLRAAVERDGHWNGELRAETRDGRKIFVDARVTLVRDEAGRPRALLAFLADVTEKKLFEEKILHAQRLESVGMLASGIAHDLNNTLAPILMAAPLLRPSLTTERELKVLKTLERSAERGAALVKQILAFAHGTTGEPRLTQVKHLARDITGMIEETFPKSIRLDCQVAGELQPVMANPTQLHQLLLNLCVNARDAMPHGGTLRISAANRSLPAAGDRAAGMWLVLEVSDTGTGIPPSVLARIWEPFFTTKGVGKGTGLGLSTVRAIVASHQGHIEVDTKLGQGTTFRAYLPAVESEGGSANASSSSATPFGRGELILVVDDEASIRDGVDAILAQHGYRVLCAANGAEAVVHFTSHAPEVALVITDVDMPHISGATLARVLSQLQPGIPLVAMSGSSANGPGGEEVHATKRVTHDFLLKPFTPNELLGVVHRLTQPSARN